MQAKYIQVPSSTEIPNQDIMKKNRDPSESTKAIKTAKEEIQKRALELNQASKIAKNEENLEMKDEEENKVDFTIPTFTPKI